MKKILLPFLLLVTGMFASCDMDKDPAGTLNGNDPFTLGDATSYRNSIYSGIRAVATSGYFTLPDIQMDMFQATSTVGNRNIVIASGDILPTTGETGTYFGALLLQIGSVNYFIEKATPLLESTDDPETIDLVNRYLAEARFARAYFNVCLFDRYCPEYNTENADAAALGIPIVEKYNPVADRGTYVGRSTMNESLAFIKQDLDFALSTLTKFEADYPDKVNMVPMTPYVNSNVVKALQARLALWTKDYATAVSKANEIINGKVRYTLAQYANYNNMWANDNSTEIIFMPFESSPQEIGSAIGSLWLSTYLTQSDYVPTYACYDMYGARDARRASYFDTRDLVFEGVTVPTICFYKYPGNPDLQEVQGKPNYVNKAKAFRLSETYLILAEASYELGDEATANSALDAIRKARINRYRSETFSGITLRDEIRLERTRELIGEGFRMGDLRRWHLKMERKKEHPENPELEQFLWQATASIEYPADSPKYTWPIPQSELDINPQMKGQQNPGY